MDTPQYIISKIRQRIGLDKDDASMDGEIENMLPVEKLRAVFGWELGDEDWAETFLELAEDCGINFNYKKAD